MQSVDSGSVALVELESSRLRVTDPTVAPSPWFARWAAPYLNDARDVTFIGLMMESVVVGAVGIALWASEVPLWIAGPLYIVGMALWSLDRFTLMLHCTSHRPLFRARYKAFNRIIPWFLGPFYGHTPNTYFAHHLGMHHREENLKDDLSTTMPFRRDRFDHWLRYYLRFMLVGIFELAYYFYKRKNSKLLTRTLVGEFGYWALVAGLAWLDPARTLVVFVAPVILIRTLMMAGNWGQHAFVDANHPGDPYRSSITCINTRYNRRCFNDGYHILHHVKASCHWTEHPIEFERNLAEYAKRDAIVFEGIDFFQVWVFLMLRRWNALAARFVQLPGAPARSREEVIALLQSRMTPIRA